jgi:squalene synthase HpnC
VVRLADAYAECERLAQSHYENFPVASLLLPRRMRPHVAAIYAFARTADDLADEGDVPSDARLAQLDVWQEQLHAAVRSPGPPASARSATAWPRRSSKNEVGSGPGNTSAEPVAPVFKALAATVRLHRLPLSLFDDLISAFRQDVVKKRYDTWDDLLDYCRRSANPVGRLVLRVAGHVDSRLDTASDAMCTALQLTNFLQDVERDWQKGRVYLPRADRERLGAREEDLAALRLTGEWHSVLADAGARTRALFETGRAVCDGVPGRLGYELRFTWLGGSRILDKLESGRFDVFAKRPTLGKADVPALLWQALTWRTGA